MMFKTLRLFSVAVVVCLFAVQVQAADPFRTTSSSSSISSSSLDAMGLGGMQAASHSEASQVRGQGTVVWGESFAYSSRSTFFGFQEAGSTNGYRSRNPSFSAGLSFAGANLPGPSNFVYGTGFSIAGGF